MKQWILEKNEELKTLQEKYHHALLQEEVFWKEKSGEKWIKEGDRNTAHSHAKVNERR